MLRYLAIAAAAVGLLAVVILGGLWYREYDNSRTVAFPSDAELSAHLARASSWVLQRRDQVLRENNPMLWLFLREAAKISADQPLLELTQAYQSKYADDPLWHFIFDSSDRGQIAGKDIYLPDTIPDYNHLFIYGATCNISLRTDPAVVALLEPSVCGSTVAGLRSPWCRTHQLMGLRFIQRNHCEAEDTTARTVASVQAAILHELKWDFRVEDAYIQKVMMLVESGRRQDVKAIWLQKILEAQRADGGWDGVDVLARLPADRQISWAAHLYPTVTPRTPSNLHATAQAIYLLALWRAPNLLSAGFLAEARVGTALGSQ
jgi:hypothetical protein